MDTCFRPLELNGLRPGDQPVAWQVAVNEARNLPAREIHAPLVRDFTEIEPHLEPRPELRSTFRQEEVVGATAFGDAVGQSPALRRIAMQIDVVVPTEASVLILGETGAGKELVAHEIHRRSARRDDPLVRVNCAFIPRELFESEFFGHVKGAFTGAGKDRAGRFETAEGGAIFLDEVGEIPLDIQNKLLRIFQEKRYERVGDDRTRRADVPTVAATNRDLKKAAAAGRFREHLYSAAARTPTDLDRGGSWHASCITRVSFEN